jgi:tetratricopeptide (TPR) repeat protein
VGSGTYLARSLLGQICEVQGRLDEAEQAYRQALADNPDFAAVVLPLAGLMFRRGAQPAEVEALVPAERPGSLLLAASACYEAGHTAEAAAWFERVLESQPDNVAARVGVVEALLAEKRYDAALAHAQVRVDGAKPDGRLALAELFLHALRGDAAALAAALADAPVADGERALFSAWQAALAGAELPAELEPVALAPAATFLEALLKVQEFSAFETLHAVYSRIAVTPATRSELLAAIYFRRGFLDSAADEWVASLQAEPAAGPLLGLAHVAVARGLQEDALVFCDEALALEPASAEAASLRDALLARAA